MQLTTYLQNSAIRREASFIIYPTGKSVVIHEGQHYTEDEFNEKYSTVCRQVWRSDDPKMLSAKNNPDNRKKWML
jgi:hypothetical protein